MTNVEQQEIRRIFLALLSSALSKSNDATRGPTIAELEAASLNGKTGSTDSGGPGEVALETLFIPEDPSRYAEVSEQVRKLFERAGPSKVSEQLGQDARYPVEGETEVEETRPSEQEIRADAAENTTEWRLAAETSSPGKFSADSGLLAHGEAYSPRNPGGLSWGTEDNGEEPENDGQDSFSGEGIEPDEEDFVEAANFGLEAMRDLYLVKEPTLYSMGLYLDSDNPAKYVATFNDQSEEARALAKYGFAVLQSTTMFKRKFPDTPTDLLLARRSQSNPLQRHCPNRGIPDCPAASLRYRTSDGSCNNLQNLWWGSAMSPMNRFLPPVYDDGVQSVRRSIGGAPLPSAREVTSVFHGDRDVPLASVTHMLMQWGQFVDHDLTATGQSRGFNGTIPQCCLNFGVGFQPPELMHPECLPISVSPQDAFFGPLGVKCLEFLRSGPAPRENCKFGPREQLTQVTSYLDASTVYSSNAFQTDTLRLFRNGFLQYGKIQSQKPVLPKQDSDLCRRGSLSTSCFRAGDGRLGEQPALTALHVVFLRLHNRIAMKLAALNPHWSDEKLFQESRRIVGAVVQHITYREYLPIVLGQDVMRIFDLEVLKKGYYEGYDPSVNPTIANEFSAAAYRFGHSLVQGSFVRFDSDHQPILNNVTIHKEFSNPANLETAGSVDRLLLGLINQPSQRRDEHISDELTNHLFQTPRFPFGMDLASINIQRGRDHGIPPYVQWREPCGLSPVKSFEDLERVMPLEVAKKFKLIYSFVEDIDLFTAGLAEKSVNGGLVGPTFACIIGQQFSNLRKGDRFWYENPNQENSFTPGQLQQIRRISLAQVLCRTMDEIDTVQPFVFLIQDTMRNHRVTCEDPAIGQLDLNFWKESQTVRSKPRVLEIFKKKKPPTPTTTAKPTTQGQTNSAAGEQSEKSFLHNLKPTQPAIYQQNKIVVRKPLGPPENISIVVHNNAVNSPVYVKEGIYGSNVQADPAPHHGNTPKPSFDHVNDRPINQGPVQSIPVYVPPKPIPTVSPLAPQASTGRPYIPYAFDDPNNPNPLSPGFQSHYGFNDVLFESYSATSPRPTLYTYYTNYPRPVTQRPYHEYVHDRPQYHESRPPLNTWPTHESQYHGGQYLSKPLYDRPGNQNNANGYAINWQELQQQGLISQLSNAGYSNTEGYRIKPNKPFVDPPRDSNWHYQNDRYRPDHRPMVEIKPLDRNEYTTWSSVSSIDKDRYNPKPSYQTIGRPVQADPDGWSVIPSYQKESVRPGTVYQTVTAKPIDRGSTNDYYSKNPSERPSFSETSKFTDYQRPRPYQNDDSFQSNLLGRPNQNNLEHNRAHSSTIRPSQDQRIEPADSFYQSDVRPKPTKVHSVTIVAEGPSETSVQTGYSTENQVTSEVPRPLIVHVNDNKQVIRRPGQYYYEKNVLHRYPDKIESQSTTHRYFAMADDVAQRHNALGTEESIDDPIVDAKGNETSETDDNREASSGEDESSTNRTSQWLTPQEDSSLPSAPELPKMSSDLTAAAKELPKPITPRNYAS
nr:uncharacterized protein LOC116427104 [Nomia melanderi]